MTRHRFQDVRSAALALLVFVGMSRSSAQDPVEGPRFMSAIRAFLAQDSVQPPPKHAIEFIGSSIFRQWTTVAEDMKPMPVFNRAFGGSRTLDILDHMDAVVIPYEPRLIVYYCGSNDVNGRIPVDSIVSRVRQFVARVHERLPETHVSIVSVNKAPQKRTKWAIVDSVNAALKALSDEHQLLGFIDVNVGLFTAEGEPRGELFRPDSLHLTPAAYAEFTKIIKPVVSQLWEDLR